MATLPVIPDVYRVAFNWTGPGGTHAVNVMHFLKASTTAAAVASTIDANVTANMWNNVSLSASVTSLVVTPLDGTSSSYTLTTTGAKWTGPQATSAYVPAAANVIKLQSTLRGRSNRGRIYLPFQSEGGMTNGVNDNTALSQTAWNNFLTAMTTAALQPVIASYLHANQHVVSAYTVESAIGTQRRRQSRLR